LEVEDDKRVRWLGQRDAHEEHDRGERERFMAALNRAPDYLQIITHTALMTGMRRGEIFSLTWGEVDFERDQITVRAHTSKTAKTRHVPIHADLKARLQTWKKTKKGAKPTDLVVPSPVTGARLDSVKKAWAALCSDAGVVDFHLHDCRHDFASRLVMRGVDLYAVRDLLGHSSVKLTERYSHLAPEVHRAAIEVL
jgi:integrase